MNIKELLKLSITALISNKLRSILTTLGIIIGVFAIILLVSLGTGLQKYITKEISGLGSNLIFVIPGTEGGARSPGGVVANKLLISDATKLEFKLKNTANVSGLIQQSTIIKYVNKIDKNVILQGVSSNYPQIITFTLNKGSFFTAGQERSGARVALVGQTVVSKLFPNTNPVGQSITLGSGNNF